MQRRAFLADVGLGFTGLALGSMLHRDGIALRLLVESADGQAASRTESQERHLAVHGAAASARWRALIPSRP